MNRLLIYALFLAAATQLTACATCRSCHKSEEMIASAKALDERFIAAFNKGDVDAAMANYWNSPELVVYPPDSMAAKGWPDSKAAMAQMLAKIPGAKLELTDANYTVAGDVVIGYGTWRLTMHPPNEKHTTMEGRLTDVKAERDGKWVYLIDHASVPLPPPEKK